MQNIDHEVYDDDELDSAWSDYVAMLHKPAQSLHDEIKKKIEDRERKTLIDLQTHIRGLSQARFELEDAVDMDSVEDSSSSSSSESESDAAESETETETGTVKILDTPTSECLRSMSPSPSPMSLHLCNKPRLIASAKSEPSTPIKNALGAQPQQHRRNRSNQAQLRSPLYMKRRTGTMVNLTSLKDDSDDSYDSDSDSDSDSATDNDEMKMQSSQAPSNTLSSPSDNNLKKKDIVGQDCHDSDSAAENAVLSANYSQDSSAESTSSESEHSSLVDDDDQIDGAGFICLEHGDEARPRKHYKVESVDSVFSEGQYERELQALKEELDQFKRRNLSHAQHSNTKERILLSVLNIEEDEIDIDASELTQCALQAIDSHQSMKEENRMEVAKQRGTRCNTSVPEPVEVPSLLQLTYSDPQRKPPPPRKLDPYSLEFGGFEPDDYDWGDDIPEGECIDDDEMSLRDRRIQCLVVIAIEYSFCSIADLTSEQNELLLLHQQSLRF